MKDKQKCDLGNVLEAEELTLFCSHFEELRFFRGQLEFHWDFCGIWVIYLTTKLI